MIEARRRLAPRHLPILFLIFVFTGMLSGGCDRNEEAEGWTRVLLEADLEGIDSVKHGAALERCIDVIETRIESFGIRGASVIRRGEDTLVVAFPSYMETTRASRLLGSTARLEFQLVAETDELFEALRDIDATLANIQEMNEADDQPGQAEREDSSTAARDEEEKGFVTWINDADLERADTQNSDFLSLIGGLQGNRLLVSERNLPAIDKALNDPAVIPVFYRDYEFLWGRDSARDEEGRAARPLYYCLRKVEIGGEHITKAEARADDDRTGYFTVDFTLDSRGSDLFERVTRLNVNRQLAIVLDGEVVSAPVIQSRVPGGRGSISGGFSVQEAHDLAVILRSGSLPVPLRVLDVNSRKNDSASGS